MKLKPWIIVSVAFVVVCLVSDRVFTVAAIYHNSSGDAGRIHHLLVENGDEIPIFGASKVYYDYSPADMGLNAFNYGLDGTSFEVTDAFLDIELAKPKTSPIIVDLKPEAEYGIGDPCAYIPFVFNPTIRQLLEKSHMMEWRYYFPGIRYFGYYDYYLKELINDRYQLMRQVIHGFSIEKYWTFDRVRLDAAVRARVQGVNGYLPDEDQNRRLLAHIQAHPERLFFLVYSPVHSSCYVNFQNPEKFEAYKAKMSALPNVVVIDDSRLNFPDEWFKDTHHLLYAGAVDFSHKLGATIKAILQARQHPAAPQPAPAPTHA